MSENAFAAIMFLMLVIFSSVNWWAIREMKGCAEREAKNTEFYREIIRVLIQETAEDDQ